MDYPNVVHADYTVFLTYFDSPKVAIALKAVELIESGKLQKTYKEVASDLTVLANKTYSHYNADGDVLKIGTHGKFFPAIQKEPLKFIQPQFEMREIL